MRQVYFSVCDLVKLTFEGDSCHSGTKSKQWVSVLCACSADGSDKLPPLVIGKYKEYTLFQECQGIAHKIWN
jgi:hypothetical protein